MKAMSKQQLADAAGVSVKVLMSWCKQYQAELEAMGVKTKTKVLPPNAVRFIAEKYCIDIMSEVTRRMGPGKVPPFCRKGTTFLGVCSHLSPA